MKRRLRGVFRLMLGLCVLLAPANVQADEPIAVEGDIAPETNGGTFNVFYRPAINDLGHVSYRASVFGGDTSHGIFLETGGGPISIAASLDFAPGTAGGVFSNLGDPAINNAGEVAFSATIFGGSVAGGVFLYSSGSITALATTQTLAPGTGGGLYASFGSSVSMNASGEIAFSADLLGGSANEGVFAVGGPSPRSVFLQGDPTPQGPSTSYIRFDSHPDINSAGHVTVLALIQTGPISNQYAIVAESAGGDVVISAVGDAAPSTGNGTYAAFFVDNPNFIRSPVINSLGEVFFRADVNGGARSGGIFVDSGGIDFALVLEGDPAPGVGPGALFYRISDTGLSPNDAGDIAFSATLLNGDSPQGLFVSTAAGGIEPVALIGDPVPPRDFGGYLGVYTDLDDNPSINGSGQAVFLADFGGGSASRGVVVVPEPNGAAPILVCVLLLMRFGRIANRAI